MFLKKVSVIFFFGVVSFLFSFSSAFSADKLVVISPHKKSIQDEFVPRFVKYYKEKYGKDVEVEWLYQGGTSSDLKFVRAKYQQNPKTSGIDVFWGGGAVVLYELSKDGFLVPMKLSKKALEGVPNKISGVTVFNKERTWIATSLSSFGIFYNKPLLKMKKIPEPKKWSDLADPKYNGLVTGTDPRKSGSAATSNLVILNALGWNKGFEVLTPIFANSSKINNSSSDAIKDVVSGATAATFAIDFYAYAKIAELGEKNVGFVLPEGETVMDPDPIAILKGAPNPEVAKRFVEFTLSKEAQKLFILPKNTDGGPAVTFLGRVAVNENAYKETEGKYAVLNPFLSKKPFKTSNYETDVDKLKVLNDLVGTTFIDSHRSLKKAWKNLLKIGLTPERIAEISEAPETEKAFLTLHSKWLDNVFRNKKINEWTDFANKKYDKLAKLKK